ncbi:hypothetical protein ACHQM5_000171 [Ranunculus cassubicifolius]
MAVQPAQVSWVSTLYPTNCEPYFALTIPKRIWSAIQDQMVHEKRVGFYEWHAGLVPLYYGKLKVEKSKKVRVIGAGWRDLAQANGYQAGRDYRFQITRADGVEILIQVTPI